MEVRFTIRGNEQEIVFSPMKDKDGRMFLRSKVQAGESISIPISSKEESPIFKFEVPSDYDIFEESQEIINERLYGLYEEWKRWTMALMQTASSLLTAQSQVILQMTFL